MKNVLMFVGLIYSTALFGQVDFSLSTGGAGLRNFSPQQKFWAFGQTVQANFHLSPKQTLYASIDYYTDGKFENDFTALAKSASASPQQIRYTAAGQLTFRHASIGWRHYFKGTYTGEKEFGIYGIAGFGFLFAKMTNSVPVDTALYAVPNLPGQATIRKLTFDLGVGAEQPLGGNFFVFADARSCLPASSHTSPYLHSQKNVPLALSLSVGLRVLFGLSY